MPVNRMPDINLVIISGRLTRDGEVRYTPGGRAVAKASVANNRRFLNPTTNEWQEEACFVDVTIWGEAAERAKDRLKKGAPVLVEGRLQFETWEAKDGSKRSNLKINARKVQFLESAFSETGAAGSASEDASAEAPRKTAVEEPAEADMEEVAL